MQGFLAGLVDRSFLKLPETIRLLSLATGTNHIPPVRNKTVQTKFINEDVKLYLKLTLLKLAVGKLSLGLD